MGFPLTLLDLAGSVALLLIVGVMMVLSASSVNAYLNYDDSYFYVKRQLILLVVGIIAAVVILKVPVSTLRALSWVAIGLAGILLANHTDFISPASMHWTRSGDLIVMAVLGGMGSVLGPVIGAVALLVLEEWLPHAISVVGYVVTGKPVVAAKEYWALILGPMLLLVVLFARGGIDGLLRKMSRG